MNAGELAFLAFGLVLGIAAGAALLGLLRSRPPAPREVRLTVSTDSVPRRPATLASATPLESVRPAPFGPGDRAADRQEADTGMAIPGVVLAEDLDDAAHRTPVLAGALPIDAIARPVDRSQLDPAVPTLVGIAIEPEADPDLASIRRASVVAVAAGAGGGERAGAGVGGGESTGAGLGGGESTGASLGAMAGVGGGADAGAIADESGGAGAVAIAGTGDEVAREDPGAAAAAVVAADAVNPDAGPCAELRRAAEERCAVAEGLAGQAEAAAATLRERQRESDEHETNAAKAADESDPHRLRAAKEAAQHEFRVASAAAGSAGAVEAAARAWLGEINRINRLAREAALTARREGEAAAALVPVLERLSVQADAARINAESAREACLVAREALAACEEATLPPVVASAALAATGGPTEPGAAPGPPAAAVGGLLGGAAGEGGSLLDADTLDVAAAAGLLEAAEPVLFRILAGDRIALRNVAGQLAGDDPASASAWEGWLAELVGAIEARAIEASSLDFPVENRFWGPFTREQCREIAAALGSLGYRFDGAGGFVDGRIPSQRDLSLAVGFAGLDPMRIRRWPNEAEMPELFREVRVASDEYIAATAPGITLGEMVTLLGRRADGLTELWNAWGRVRPLLLAPA